MTGHTINLSLIKSHFSALPDVLFIIHCIQSDARTLKRMSYNNLCVVVVVYDLHEMKDILVVKSHFDTSLNCRDADMWGFMAQVIPLTDCHKEPQTINY